jgi:hypothetical protein
VPPEHRRDAALVAAHEQVDAPVTVEVGGDRRVDRRQLRLGRQRLQAIAPAASSSATALAIVRASRTVARRSSSAGKISSIVRAPKLAYDGKRLRSVGTSLTRSSRPASGWCFPWRWKVRICSIVPLPPKSCTWSRAAPRRSPSPRR